jgi:hypothetical protein
MKIGTLWILYAFLKSVHGAQMRGRFEKEDVPLYERRQIFSRVALNVGSIPAGNVYQVQMAIN